MDDRTYYVRTPDLAPRSGAGGVVVRLEEDEVLVGLVKETEIGPAHFVLPKGGLEPGESIDAGARREIHEETGITDLVLLHDFGAFFRVSFDRRYWQQTHYGLYYTRQFFGNILDVQHHFDFGWFALDSLPNLFWTDERQLIVSNRLMIDQLARKQAASRLGIP